MPSPARLVGRSVLHLRRKGYSEDFARKVIKEVVEAIASDRDAWEPWALDWWRKLWHEANGTGTTAHTRTQPAGKDNHE